MDTCFTSLNSNTPMNTPLPIPTIIIVRNAGICSVIEMLAFVKSNTRKGSIIVNGVLNMLSNFNMFSILDFPMFVKTASALVPVSIAASNKLLQNESDNIAIVVAVKKISMKSVVSNVTFRAFVLNVSSSFSLSLAVLSNTIKARAIIAILPSINGGTSIAGCPFIVICASPNPANSSKNISGILILFAIHDRITPTNRMTASAVVMASAFMRCYSFVLFINLMFVRCFKLSGKALAKQ